jgi:hypothetical protein
VVIRLDGRASLIQHPRSHQTPLALTTVFCVHCWHADPGRLGAKNGNAADAGSGQKQKIRKGTADEALAMRLCAAAVGMFIRRDIAGFVDGHGGRMAKAPRHATHVQHVEAGKPTLLLLTTLAEKQSRRRAANSRSVLMLTGVATDPNRIAAPKQIENSRLNAFGWHAVQLAYELRRPRSA